MFHSIIGILSLCLTSPVLTASASFGLYAHGDNIGGRQMYYADVIHDDHGLVSNPISTDMANKPDLLNASLLLPGSSSYSKRVKFTNDLSTDEVINKFVWYGNFLMVEDDSGKYTPLFPVKKSSSSTNDGEYSLLWNVTDHEEVIDVSMKSIIPSNVGSSAGISMADILHIEIWCWLEKEGL